MRSIAVVVLGSVSLNAGAAVPDLLCQELKVALLNPVTLRTTEVRESRTLYRFKGGDLFLSGPDVKEYRYGRVVQQEPLRFGVGHKTLLFEDDFRRGTFVHVYTDEVRVSHASCNRT
jgi:hypothetical protein